MENLLCSLDGDTDNKDSTSRRSELDQVASAIKIPPFWHSNPELWFLRIEAQFNVRGITSDNTKYDYLVSALSEDTMEIVADAVRRPPATDKYKNIKKLLLSRSKETEEKRLDSLLNRIELGDLRPSELYRQMDTLATENSLVNQSLLRKLWMAKLPPTIQPCLIALESSHSVDEQLEIADKIHGSTDRAPRVSVVSRNENEDLRIMISELAQKIDRLETRSGNNRGRPYTQRQYSEQQGYPNRFSRSKSRNRTPSRHRSPSGHMVECRYHRRFGDKARKCFPNCSRNNRSSPSTSNSKN